MRLRRTLSLAVLLLAVGACARRAAEGPETSGLSTPAAAASQVEELRAMGYLDSTGAVQTRIPASPGTEGAPALAAPATGVGALDSLWTQQKLIRDARIGLEVESVEAAAVRIEEVAGAGRGLVAGSELRKGPDGRRSGSVTLRVPSGSFDATLAKLRELGEVRSESTSTADVTKAYADLEARLAVKRRTQERLEVLLTTRSGSLNDLLQVERELERVVTQIEQMLGEKRYYDQRIAVSTITISLFEPGVALQPNAMAPVGDALRASVRTFAQSFAALIYLTMTALPWLLIAALLWTLIRRARRRRKTRSAA